MIPSCLQLRLVRRRRALTLLLSIVLTTLTCGCGGGSRPAGALDSKDTVKRVYALENLRDAETASEADLSKALELMVDDSFYGNKIVGRKREGMQEKIRYQKGTYTTDKNKSVGDYKVSDLAFKAVTVHQPAAANLAAKRLAEEATIPEEDRVPEDVQMPNQPKRFSGDKLRYFKSQLIDVILDCCNKMPDYKDPEAMAQLAKAGKKRP